MAQDSVSIAGLNVANQIFGSVTRAANVLNGEVSGILGLAFQSIATSQAKPLVQQLAESGVLSQNIISCVDNVLQFRYVQINLNLIHLILQFCFDSIYQCGFRSKHGEAWRTHVRLSYTHAPSCSFLTDFPFLALLEARILRSTLVQSTGSRSPTPAHTGLFPSKQSPSATSQLA